MGPWKAHARLEQASHMMSSPTWQALITLSLPWTAKEAMRSVEVRESMHFTTRRALEHIPQWDRQVPTEYELYTDGGYQDGLATASALVLSRAQKQLIWITALWQLVAEGATSPQDGATGPTNDCGDGSNLSDFTVACTGLARFHFDNEHELKRLLVCLALLRLRRVLLRRVRLQEDEQPSPVRSPCIGQSHHALPSLTVSCFFRHDTDDFTTITSFHHILTPFLHFPVENMAGACCWCPCWWRRPLGVRPGAHARRGFQHTSGGICGLTVLTDPCGRY